MKNDKDMEKLNQMDTDGVNFRHQKQKEKAKKFSYEEAKKKKEAKQHSKKAQVYQANDGEAPGKKKSRLKFGEGESVKTEKTSVVKKAGSATSVALHREISKNEDDNAAVEGAHKLEESGEGVYRLEQRSARRRKQRVSRKRSRLERQEEKQTQAAARQEQKKLKKQIQKQQIKRDYAKAKRSEQTVGTATKGTIDYIKKIGGKVTNFFKENRKVYISVAVLIGLMFLIITNVTSCSAVFLQNVITYTGTSYLSSDQAIREAELYYTQLEANLQERINNMESEEPGHEEYRYNIGPIEHDPFILISYLSAKYEEFTFEQVKPELDALFGLQYRLETEAVNETVTETATVRVGESLGQVVTSGYCNCPICCGIWSGGPTASGAYPTANHTLAVDASNPFVPMGTKVVMNGVEYTVEDTGAFARYGVQFDVYYDSHAAASAHGHQTWECYLADDNGSNEVEVTRTRDVDVLNVTLNSGNLMSICQDRLGFFQKELFSAYNDTKGNLQDAQASEPTDAKGTVDDRTVTGIEEQLNKEGETAESVTKTATEGTKEFYTISTKSGKIFYLIIDNSKSQDNVYFLTEVSEKDLMNFTLSDSVTLPEVDTVYAEPEKKAEEEKPETTESAEKDKVEDEIQMPEDKSPFGTYLLIALVAVGAAAGGYYFKVYKPKHEYDDEDEMEEDEDESEDSESEKREVDDADEQEESAEPEILRDEDFNDDVLEDEEEEQE